MVLRLTILGVSDCGLCQEAMTLATTLQRHYRFELEYRVIDQEPELRARYGLQVPVALLDGEELCWGHITEARLREALAGARRSRPISRILSRLGWFPRG